MHVKEVRRIIIAILSVAISVFVAVVAVFVAVRRVAILKNSKIPDVVSLHFFFILLMLFHLFVPILCLLCCDMCHIDLFLLKFACVHASACPSPSKSMLRAPCRVLRLLPKDYQIRLCRIRHFLWSYRIGTFASRS